MSDLSTFETPNSRFLDRAGLGGFPWFTAIALYTISYGWFWNIRNSFWRDDWWAFYESGISHWWYELGLPKWTFANKWLFELIGPGFMRAVVFFLFFMSGICLYGILEKFSYVNEKNQKLAVLLFLILPFNSTRATLMVFHYSTAYFYFFFAWYLIITFKSVWIKVLAAFLFFISFQMHSLPVFFALPILHLFSLEKIKELKQLIIWVRRNLFLILLPPLYWTLRWFFWNAKIQGYHNPSIPQLVLLSKILVVPSLIVVLILVLARYRFVNSRGNLYCIAVSLFVIFLGLAPYIAFGCFNGRFAEEGISNLRTGYWIYFLGASGWEDRFLMLQPLGVALIICGFLSLIPQKLKRMQMSLQNLILSICVMLNLGFGFEYMVHYAKQKEVTKELVSAGYDRAFTDYAIIDRTAYLNVRGVVDEGWLYLVPIAYGLAPDQLNISYECRSSDEVRLVVIDGEASYWNALQSWLNRRNFGFSVKILDGPTPCTADFVEYARGKNQIPIVFYFIDAKSNQDGIMKNQV